MERVTTAELSYEALAMQILASYCVPSKKCTRYVVTYPTLHVSRVVLRTTLVPKDSTYIWNRLLQLNFQELFSSYIFLISYIFFF